MKKIIGLLFAVICTSSLFAQSFSLGVRAGINSSSLSTNINGVKEGSQQIGFVGGAFSRIGVLGFYIEPSVLYSQRKGDFDASGKTLTTTLHYVDVPVMIGYSFLGIARACIGPNFQFLTNATQAGDATDPNFSAGNFNNAGLGFQAGVGVDISRVTIDLRYDGCITNLGKEVIGSNNQKYDYSTRASMWQLTVGYKFIKL